MARKPTYEELKKSVKELEKEVAKRKRMEEEPSKSEERYRRLVETMNDGLGIQDEKGRGTTFNVYLPASEKEVGIEKKRSWLTRS